MADRQVGAVLGEVRVGAAEIAMSMNSDPIALGDEVAEAFSRHETFEDRATVGFEHAYLGDQRIAGRAWHVDGIPIKIDEVAWVGIHAMSSGNTLG